MKVRSPITCKTFYGICAKCYGFDLGNNEPVKMGTAAGVLAASVAVATSISFSINASLWVGAACYLAIGPIGFALAAMSREQKTVSPSAARSRPRSGHPPSRRSPAP